MVLLIGIYVYVQGKVHGTDNFCLQLQYGNADVSYAARFKLYVIWDTLSYTLQT
jgi:hypothetical protein